MAYDLTALIAEFELLRGAYDLTVAPLARGDDAFELGRCRSTDAWLGLAGAPSWRERTRL